MNSEKANEVSLEKDKRRNEIIPDFPREVNAPPKVKWEPKFGEAEIDAVPPVNAGTNTVSRPVLF